MPKPVFSIATPTRNALANLRRCVGSVRGQQGVSVEHLVQDACSGDGTPAWLEAQSVERPNFKPVSCFDEGMYDAIQRSWARSGGQYLAWLNSDEQYLPGTLQRVQQFFDAHPEVDVVSGDYLVVDDAGRAVALRREIPLRRFYVANSFLNALSCTLFFRRRLWEGGRLGFDKRWRYAADKDLILKLEASGAKFHHLPHVLSVFGIDGSNLSTHVGMRDEAEALRLIHGGFRFKPLRVLPLLARRAERLLRGGYGRVNFEYQFALDEVPNYAHFRASALGGRYSLADTQGAAERIDLARQPQTHF